MSGAIPQDQPSHTPGTNQPTSPGRAPFAALARYVACRMGDPTAVLAADETGFIKKGRMPGVARMYTGTAGRVENCQVGVFTAYATPDGARALIDRELYLPEKWTDDRARCRKAGIGDDVVFATKPDWTLVLAGGHPGVGRRI